IQADIPIVGSCDAVLQDMIEQINEAGKKPDDKAIAAWWEQIDEWRARHGLYTAPRHGASGGEIIKPQDVIKVLHRVTGGKAYVAAEGGQHQLFASRYYRFSNARQWLHADGLGTRGCGLPAAMGAKMAFP